MRSLAFNRTNPACLGASSRRRISGHLARPRVIHSSASTGRSARPHSTGGTAARAVAGGHAARARAQRCVTTRTVPAAPTLLQHLVRRSHPAMQRHPSACASQLLQQAVPTSGTATATPAAIAAHGALHRRLAPPLLLDHRHHLYPVCGSCVLRCALLSEEFDRAIEGFDRDEAPGGRTEEGAVAREEEGDAGAHTLRQAEPQV